MNIIFNTILAIFLAFIFDNILYFKLPINNEIKVYIKDDNIEYKKFNIKNSFKEKKIIKKPTKKPIQKDYILIKDLKLNAIFAVSENSGYIMFEHKKNTYILSINEEYKGYKLIKLFSDYVVFIKNNKEYKLGFKKEKEKFSIIKNNKPIEIINETQSVVKRDIVSDYIKNPQKIWSNIAIDGYYKGGKLYGFIVRKVKHKSVFEKLGLKRGDIILEANNIRLNSVNGAFEIYNRIKEITNLNLIILRDNKEMELEYEIK